MPRYRTPPAVARVTGADRLHPGRHAQRVEVATGPLGEPPQSLNEAERKAWVEYADAMPWLGRADRTLVRLASRLTVKIGEPDCPLGAYTQLRLCLASMGGTPVDRSRVSAHPDVSDDPADEFFN